MNPMKLFCLIALLVVGVTASPKKAPKNYADSTVSSAQWLTASELESMPSIEDLTVEKLEAMPAEKAAQLLEKLYHVSQIKHELRPAFVPTPSSVPAYIIKPTGEKVPTTLNALAAAANKQAQLGNDEVTVIITGLPQASPAVQKATHSLVKAFLQRYNAQQQRQQSLSSADFIDTGLNNKKQQQSSSEETQESWKQSPENNGHIIVIDLGATLTNFRNIALLDIQQTGAMIAKALVQMANNDNVLPESIHVVAQGIAAHVAGAAANEYERMTGQKWRRITALDPSKVYARAPNSLPRLARGDADFVDAIHTSAYGLGSPQQVGNVDFYPSGPSDTVPGADNIIEASMRATRYFAESVRPGNERNFPAVQASSLEEYQNQNGFGKRTYMGIDADYDLQGDYFLEVNPVAPYGQRTPASQQGAYHAIHAHAQWQGAQDY